MIVGTRHGDYMVLKQSGDMFELSDGKQVIKLSEADIKKKAWDKGELMYKIPQPKKAVKKKSTTKAKKK